MQTDPSHRPISLSLRMRLWLWGIVVGLSLGMVAMDRALQHLRASSLQTWQENLRQAETLKASTWKQIEKLYMAHRSAGSRLTRQDMQKQLNGGQMSANGNALVWQDPMSGLVVHFAFNEKGDWTSYQTSPGRAPQPQPPGPSDLERMLSTVRGVGGTICTPTLWLPLWAMALPATLMDRKYRMLATEVAALLALVLCTGLMLNPNWPGRMMSPRNIEMSRVAAIAMLTLMVAGVALTRQWLDRPGDAASSPLCVTCGYNLTGNESGVCPECGAPANFIVYKQILDQILREKRDQARLEADARAPLNPENHPH